MEDDARLVEAARHWMDRLPRYPRPLIERAYPENRGLTQLTQIRATCPRCYADYDGRTESLCAQDHEPLALIVNPQCRYGGALPAWGALWGLGDDEPWARAHLDLLDRLGFTVYDAEDLGLLMGIDAAGYAFFPQHFSPCTRRATGDGFFRSESDLQGQGWETRRGDVHSRRGRNALRDSGTPLVAFR